jgi:hypothetical protein
MTDSPPGAGQAAEVGGLTNLSSFTLFVGSDEGASVTVAGVLTKCDLSCTLQFPAGTSVTIHAKVQNLSDCLRFGSWDGACTGQGNPCTLVMNTDLSTSASSVRIPGCVPQ